MGGRGVAWYLWAGSALRAMGGRRAWLALLLALPLAQWAAAGPAGGPGEPISAVQIPLTLDLGPLFAAAESALPTRAGHWPGFRDWHGIATRYRAWRGPLALAMHGDTVQAQAHVRYQIEARKGLFAGIELSAGCGVDEPPRQALIGLLARLQWAPDWTLHPGFRVLPTRFLDRCEVTVANLDVSPLVGEVFEERIESSIRESMAALRPRLERLRGEAARAWLAIQAPRELTPGVWLRIEPLGLALAPPQGSGSRLQTAVWLAFRASLSGARVDAPATPTPLPPLLPYRPSQPGLHFALRLKLDYPGLSAALAERLTGQTVEVEGRKARVSDLTLSAKGEDLVLTLGLAGDLAGRLTLMARPGFDGAAQALRLNDLGFVFDAEDLDLGLAANLFYDRISARIESEANGLLAERTGRLRDALDSALRQALPGTLTPDLSGLRLASLAIGVAETGLTLDGTAEGTLALKPAAAP